MSRHARHRANARERRLDTLQPVAFGLLVAAAVYAMGLYAIARGL